VREGSGALDNMEQLCTLISLTSDKNLFIRRVLGELQYLFKRTLRQHVDEAELGGGRERRGLGLQAVARAHLVNGHAPLRA
jgi:hypothetical protein